jgi:hypothetical protein
MVREGASVSYTGVDGEYLATGDQGRVLSVSDTVAHVLWATGSCVGQVSAAYDQDLLSLGSGGGADDALDDCLEVGGLVTFSARQAYDGGGEVAVLDQMAEAGHLAMFADVAQDALALVASRIRSDASFRAVVADLDEDEAESVLRLASACLVRDAFSTDED